MARAHSCPLPHRSHSAQSSGSTAASDHTHHPRQERDARPVTAAELDAQSRLRASAAKAAAMRAKMEAAVADQQLLAAEAARARVEVCGWQKSFKL